MSENQSNKRYYVTLPRFSIIDNFIMLPPDCQSESESIDHQKINLWGLSLLKKSVYYYTSKFPEMYPEPHRRLRNAQAYEDFINWLDENQIYYHYEFAYEVATKPDVFINPYTFQPDTNYWNYIKCDIRLYIPDDQVVFARLSSDIQIQIDQ